MMEVGREAGLNTLVALWDSGNFESGLSAGHVTGKVKH